MHCDFRELERKYKKDLERLGEWNYLRNYYRELFIYNNLKKNTVSGRGFTKFVNLLKEIRNVFYGFSAWFKKYKYVVFSNNERRLLKDGTFFDVRVDYLIQLLGEDETLLVETPVNGHKDKKLLPVKNIVSRRLIDVLTIFFEKLWKKNNNIQLLNKIHKECKISFDYSRQINRFKVQYRIYLLWFKLIRPKAIFLVCYYDKQYLIKAAHELGIQVIEIQHGIISKNHFAYFSVLKLNQVYLPDYLLSFDTNLKNENSPEFLFDKEKVFPVGSFYLEYLKTNFKEDKNLKKIIENYNLVIGVSLQWTVENELIEFLSRVARRVQNILFILIPRKWEPQKYKKIRLPSNIIFYPKLDCYQIILHCNYHCTVYSTCALEAPLLGVPNILINLNGLTERYLSYLFQKKHESCYIVKNEEEFVNLLQYDEQFANKQEYFMGQGVYMNSYKKNLDDALHHILNS